VATRAPRGTGGSEVPASKLLPESWLSPWRQLGPGEVAWGVDRYNLPHGEVLAGTVAHVGVIRRWHAAARWAVYLTLAGIGVAWGSWAYQG
jgi:hypothetical protein